MTEQQIILQNLYRSNHYKRVFKLYDEILYVLQNTLGQSKDDAEKAAARHEKKIWDALILKFDEEKSKGLYPTFEVADPIRRELLWFPAISSRDQYRERQLKLRLAYRGVIANYLDGMSSREYEALGCVVSQISGAQHCHLTPPGNEYGIDFVAILPAYGNGHLFPHTSKQIRIIGQSKKWNSPVKRSDVDLLCTTLNLVRTKGQRVLEKLILPSWFISAQGPIIGCMVSHSGAQSGAIDIANDHGVIMADSRDITQIITLWRNWDINTGWSSLQSSIEFEINSFIQ